MGLANITIRGPTFFAKKFYRVKFFSYICIEIKQNKMLLNLERLNLEYVQWCIANKDGRNEQDLRFGQYLWTKYKNMKDFTDVFNY